MWQGELRSSRERISDHGLTVVTLLGIVGSLSFAVYKLHFGVDVDDEAFYLVIPYRFLLGDLPLVDHLDLQQSSAALTYPLVRIWYALHGDLEGIVLFHRRLYFAFSCGLGVTVFLCFRRQHGRLVAATAALFPVLFIPLCIPTLSYITLAMGFMSLGLYLVWLSWSSPRLRRYELLAGTSHALACLAFPPYAVGVLFFLGLRWISEDGARRRALLWYAAPIGLVGSASVAFLLLLGPEHLVEALRVKPPSAGGGLAKLRVVVAQFAAAVAHPWLLAGGLALALGVYRWRAGWGRWLLALWPLLVWWSLKPIPEHMSTMPFVSLYALAGPIFWWTLEREQRDPRILVQIWLPSFGFGLLSAWGAANGFVNASLGLAPGAVATSFCLVSLPGDASRSDLHERLGRLTPLILVALILVGGTREAVYRDGRLPQLESKVGSGPYAGLHTTATRRLLLEQLEHDLSAVESPGARLLVYNGFSAGYLLTSMRPATPFAWLLPMRRMRPIYASRYAATAGPRDVVLHLKYRGVPLDDPLHHFVESQFERVVDRPAYAIYSSQLPEQQETAPGIP